MSDAFAAQDISPVRNWEAQLALRFARHPTGTRLVERSHRGPLVVQRTFHHEGPDVCQAVIVHPPGGIAGGDRLSIRASLDAGAHAQLVTPAASKWYRSAGASASQSIEAQVADRAVLEWLPHESILFDGARAEMETRLVLAGVSVAFAWDIVCLGRIASGETFRAGGLTQRIELVRDGVLGWVEQNVVEATGRARSSAVGLAQRPAFGTFVIAAPAIPDEWVARARAVGSELALGDAAITRVPGALLMRCRASATDLALQWFRALWTALRAPVIARAAVLPRIWST